MGYSVVLDGTEFDSKFEYDAYNILKEKGYTINTHVPYKQLGIDSLFIADFLIGNTVVEVSSFTLQNHPSYAEKIKIKKSLVEQANYAFVFCNTLAEVRRLKIVD